MRKPTELELYTKHTDQVVDDILARLADEDQPVIYSAMDAAYMQLTLASIKEYPDEMDEVVIALRRHIETMEEAITMWEAR